MKTNKIKTDEIKSSTKSFLLDESLREVNIKKVEKTVLRSLNKAFFYLDAKFNYDLTKTSFCLNNNKLQITAIGHHDFLFELFKIDGHIRKADDFIDNRLNGERFDRAVFVDIINEMISFDDETSQVAELFMQEEQMLHNCNKENIKVDLEKIINIRPCDFFLLVDKIVRKFGTHLSEKDFHSAKYFFYNFQILRDLLDDIMSVDKDLLNKEHNSIIIAKENGVSELFIRKIIATKIKNLKHAVSRIKDKEVDFFIDVISFWENHTKNLFLPLLESYYKSLKEFRKKYFIIKQV
jgi:hypothetical protein